MPTFNRLTSHHTRELGTGRERQFGLHLVLVLNHEDVREVHAGGADVDRNLARPGLEIRECFQDEGLRWSVLVASNGAHGVSG